MILILNGDQESFVIYASICVYTVFKLFSLSKNMRKLVLGILMELLVTCVSNCAVVVRVKETRLKIFMQFWSFPT